MHQRDAAPLLAEALHAVSLEPERIDELVAAWETRLAGAGYELSDSLAALDHPEMQRQLALASEVVGLVEERRHRLLRDLVDGMRAAAMVIAQTDIVLAANRQAEITFSVSEHASLKHGTAAAALHQQLLVAIAEENRRPSASGRFLQIALADRQRPLLVHVKGVELDKGTSAVLVVGDEPVWSDTMSAMLRDAFAVTPAEVDVLRLLVRGETVASIARLSAKSEGTIRSQLHALFEKTGAGSQADLIRLALLLSHAAALPRSSPESTARRSSEGTRLELPDGRRLDFRIAGRADGRPILWLMSTIGLGRWRADAEAALAERGLRLVAPIRAGFGRSDQPPPGRPIHRVAADDTLALMDRLGIGRCPIVAPGDDVRIALMLAKERPDRVSAIFGLAAGFPVRTPDQYRRMHPMARFFRANARHAPSVLVYITKVVRAMTRMRGVDAYILSALKNAPRDAAVFGDPHVAQAVRDGFQAMIGKDVRCEQAFAAEVAAFVADWPEGLGDVACPVTLFHGELDQNAPIETAREYQALHPQWRMESFPDEGQLVAYSRWRDLLDLIDQAA